MPGVNMANTRTENIGPGDFNGHPADRHEPLQSSRVEGQKALDEAEGMRDSHINRTHIHENGTKEVVEPFFGNKAVRSVNDEVEKVNKEFIDKQS
jgi:hypothetical protein